MDDEWCAWSTQKYISTSSVIATMFSLTESYIEMSFMLSLQGQLTDGKRKFIIPLFPRHLLSPTKMSNEFKLEYTNKFDK